MSDPGASGYRRGLALVTSASLLVPVIGVVTAPVLTHSLLAAGRGEVGAALAPNLLLVGVATLGLPESLTYHVAKMPHVARRALLWAILFGSAIGIIGIIGTYFATPFLTAGDSALGRLMTLATLLTLPTLLVSLLRGVATGRQMWRAVALERVIGSVVRLVALVSLALIGHLTVFAAVVVIGVAPILGGLVYWRLVLRSHRLTESELELDDAPIARSLLGFGSRVWLGSVATMVMARLSQLLVTPLSNTTQLGLLLVAVSISDIPYIVTQTIRDVIFGVNSARADIDRLQSTSRVATLLAFAGSAVLGVTLPLWIGPLFSHEFVAATTATWILLAASTIAVPGLIAGAGLDSSGRPGLKSIALVTALVSYLLGLLVLVPPFGATGAALAALISTLLSTTISLIAVRIILNTSISLFLVPRVGDLKFLGGLALSALGRLTVRHPS